MTLIISAPGVLANDTDPEGNTITALLVSSVSHGSLTLNPDGSFAYTPAPGYNGTDGFAYLATDGLLSTQATVTITVNPVNDPPVANAGPDQLNVPAGSTVTLDGSGSTDFDGDPLTYSWSFVDRPGDSTSTFSDPAAVKPTFVIDKAGTYVVQLIVNDGKINSAADMVNIEAVTVNHPPVAQNISISIAVNTQDLRPQFLLSAFPISAFPIAPSTLNPHPSTSSP